MIIDPLKLRDMRMPIITSPAMPSHIVPLSILSPSQKKLDEGGGRLATAAPLETVHTVKGSSITYAKLCSGRPHILTNQWRSQRPRGLSTLQGMSHPLGMLRLCISTPAPYYLTPLVLGYRSMILEVDYPAVKSPTRERTYILQMLHLPSPVRPRGVLSAISP